MSKVYQVLSLLPDLLDALQISVARRTRLVYRILRMPALEDRRSSVLILRSSVVGFKICSAKMDCFACLIRGYSGELLSFSGMGNLLIGIIVLVKAAWGCVHKFRSTLVSRYTGILGGSIRERMVGRIKWTIRDGSPHQPIYIDIIRRLLHQKASFTKRPLLFVSVLEF